MLINGSRALFNVIYETNLSIMSSLWKRYRVQYIFNTSTIYIRFRSIQNHLAVASKEYWNKSINYAIIHIKRLTKIMIWNAITGTNVTTNHFCNKHLPQFEIKMMKWWDEMENLTWLTINLITGECMCLWKFIHFVLHYIS